MVSFDFLDEWNRNRLHSGVLAIKENGKNI